MPVSSCDVGAGRAAAAWSRAAAPRRRAAGWGRGAGSPCPRGRAAGGPPTRCWSGRPRLTDLAHARRIAAGLHGVADHREHAALTRRQPGRVGRAVGELVHGRRAGLGRVGGASARVLRRTWSTAQSWPSRSRSRVVRPQPEGVRAPGRRSRRRRQAPAWGGLPGARRLEGDGNAGRTLSNMCSNRRVAEAVRVRTFRAAGGPGGGCPRPRHRVA